MSLIQEPLEAACPELKGIFRSPHFVNFSFNPVVLLSLAAAITSWVKESKISTSASVAPDPDHDVAARLFTMVTNAGPCQSES